jgi:LmbE family N-acetylglucosaminyl deacetylase
MAKIIFFQAHPDDLEFTCSHLLYYLSAKSKKIHNIRIASMTRGEFGLFGYDNENFKGKRLGRIRTLELYRAQKMYGISPQNIDFLGYIDGSVKFNKEAINNIVIYLKKHKPDIILAPEPRWTVYTHKDHVNTGKILFFIIYNKLIDKIPKLYYFSSINSNFWFPFEKEEIKFTRKLLACHASQKKLLDKTLPIYGFLHKIYGRHLKGWKYAEGYRQVFFGRNQKLKNKPSLFARMVSHFCFGASFFVPKPDLYIIHKNK